MPAKSLFDHLQAGYTVDGFLEQFPTVQKQQVQSLLQELEQKVERGAQPVDR